MEARPWVEVWIDGVQLFSVTDSTFDLGRIGLYSWGNERSHYDDIVVEDLATGVTLLSEDFSDGHLSDWTIIDEGSKNGPSVWSATTGTLIQSSNIHSSWTIGDLDWLGTYVLYGTEWADYRVTLTIKSDDNDAIGVMFRYQERKELHPQQAH